MFFHICLRYDRLFTVGKIETWPFQISQSPRFPLEKFHGRNDLGHHKVQVMRYPTRNWRLKDEPEMPETKFKFLEVPNHNQVWFQCFTAISLNSWQVNQDIPDWDLDGDTDSTYDGSDN